MKQVVGVLLLASTMGLVIAATSSASTNRTEISCAALEAAIKADTATALKAARTGDAATMLRMANEVKALVAQGKGCARSNNGAGSNTAPTEVSSSTLPAATWGKSYPARTFCAALTGTHRTRTGNQCLDADGKLITFQNKGDLLPIGMHFDPFTGTVSGTPRSGPTHSETVHLRVCWGELTAYTHCTDATLRVSK